MQKQLVLSFFCVNFLIIAQENQIIEKAAHIVEKIYGPRGLKVNFSDLEKIEKLFIDCVQASQYQLNLASTFIIQSLQTELNDLDTQIEQHKKESKIVSQKQFYKKFLLQQQIKHFNHYLSVHKLTFNQKMYGIGHRAYEVITKYGKDFFGYDFVPITAKLLAQEILGYIEFEREQILYNYENLHHFLSLHKKIQPPKIVDFWDTQEIQEKIIKRARLLSPEAEVQFEGLLMSFALQGLVMAGGEVAMQNIAAEDQEIFKQYQKKQTDIGNQWNTFQEQIGKERKAIGDNIIQGFKTQQTQLQSDYQASNERMSEAMVYLNQSINLDKPIKHYLDPKLLIYDQCFEGSPMYTPKRHPWYNPFGRFTNGDWEFDLANNSFWQNAMTTMPKEFIWNKKVEDQNIFTQDPAIYSIFTEYIPLKLNYDIEIECTLINCQYPFFAGIMFNKGRWISGDPERMWWYRLFGLYGTQEKENDPKTRTINLAFAQQILDIPNGDKDKEKITSPLEQIFTKKTDPINFALDKKDIDYLNANPITFVFRITTQRTSVQLELDKKQNGTIQKLYSGSVDNLAPYIYVYHGIGFMAVGCQVQFKINKPTDLVYSDNEIKEFKEKMKKVL